MIVSGIEINDTPCTDASIVCPETILCLHGLGGDHHSFDPQSETLKSHYRVVAWNMPGYKSSTPLAEVTFERLSNAVILLLDKLHLTQVHIMGQSIGGMIAQELALQHPERVSSVILVATTSAFGAKNDNFKEAFLRARLAPLQAGESMSSIAAQAISSIVGTQTRQAVLDSAINSMAQLPQDTYTSILNCLVTFNRYTDISKISCPACLVAGAEDKNSPAITMEKMANRIKLSQYHCIPGAGHLVNLEKPETFNQIVLDFLASI